ncbi:hypothetical protein SOJ_23380 [Staphylococcus sp. OJ82]|nr:hypothetical protein SOJ_23380 [Staphylococcus sp. OJ82]
MLPEINILTVLGILLDTIMFICSLDKWNMSVIETLLTPINRERIVNNNKMINRTIPLSKNFIMR